MSLCGRHEAGTGLELEGAYGGGWSWRIVFETTHSDNLWMRMDNLIPTEHATAEIPAGPYPAMIIDLRRAAP